jgi:hypothetical protein
LIHEDIGNYKRTKRKKEERRFIFAKEMCGKNGLGEEALPCGGAGTLAWGRIG